MRRMNSPSNKTEWLHRKPWDIMLNLSDGEYGIRRPRKEALQESYSTERRGLSLGGNFKKGMKTYRHHPRERLQSSYQDLDEPRTSHLQE